MLMSDDSQKEFKVIEILLEQICKIDREFHSEELAKAYDMIADRLKSLTKSN